ncbi:4-hydroxyphenylpyruvate dioxygenase [Aquidulcibacter sp.]|jgi:4-hydroxyphenylpyruvate dioxygenase|uniref:4-hydroxyphenylpyruvate dioxygenase n=1 Tax=Aquidulcibacter sp. TaxID=2052990 RepID=UPI0022CD02C4|nr:4-hydroxyphenylpyruvate dioxygenase [Aquidulcibacter sp.]MCE2892209.1 4-hydroxyphenylpyruvate dioxygenase [Hyphomonadaceae bacterium]MCZ8208366.1 4-hydroxyphenylpyruvate dioxygenase [Aquidulcibacter sp.]
MADLFENPLGTDGFEFVEFTSPDPDALATYFRQLGFTAVSKHRSKNVIRFKQGDINFILNMEPVGQAAEFREQRGPSANAMAFRVKDAAHAFREAIARGAEAVDSPIGPMELDIPAIKGIGGAFIYLVDRYGAQSIYDVDFKPIPGAAEEEAINSTGLTYLDHLTHNVFRGKMDVWADYYERIFNFREIRYFDIEGKVSGLFSKAMTSPCGKIRIPLNESKGEEGKTDQIEEFLQRYKGEGIQHIAMGSSDLLTTVDHLRARGVELQDTIDTYFDLIDTRLPGHGHDVEALRQRRVLIDGAPSEGQGLLLQIFGKDAVGPIFFEFIQRKGNEGFGEGNFKALFESIELDQIRRGVLQG